MGIIYMFTSPSGKSYIGQTIRSLPERKSKHVSEAKSQCLTKRCSPYFHNAIRKYGIEAFQEQILVEVDNDMLDYFEEHYISTYNTMHPNGYNLTSGGCSNKQISEETRRRMSETRKGLIQSNEDVRKQLQMNGFNRKANKLLPMYISEEKSKSGELVGYRVAHHPNNQRVRKFCNKKDINEALDRALQYLDTLNNLVSPISDSISISCGRKRKTDATASLPKYIVQVKKKNNVIGYAVNGHQIGYKRKDFTKRNCLEQNLEDAKMYLQSILREAGSETR